MPLFRFTVSNGSTAPQGDLIDLPDITTAQHDLTLLAGESLKDAGERFWHDGDWTFDLSDEDGLTLCSIMVHGTEAPALRNMAANDAN